MIDVKLGKKAARHDPRTLVYAKYRTATEPPPPDAHWGRGLPFAMLGNDQYGDCVEAGYAHQVQIWGDRSGHPFVPTGQEALDAYIGLQLPLSAQNQVGSEWAVTTGQDALAGSWGGHCVPLSGYDQNTLWCVTWGKLQAMTWQFLTTYCDEAFVLLATDWIAASGQSPSRMAWGQLLADLQNL